MIYISISRRTSLHLDVHRCNTNHMLKRTCISNFARWSSSVFNWSSIHSLILFFFSKKNDYFQILLHSEMLYCYILIYIINQEWKLFCTVDNSFNITLQPHHRPKRNFHVRWVVTLWMSPQIATVSNVIPVFSLTFFAQKIFQNLSSLGITPRTIPGHGRNSNFVCIFW